MPTIHCNTHLAGLIDINRFLHDLLLAFTIAASASMGRAFQLRICKKKTVLSFSWPIEWVFEWHPSKFWLWVFWPPLDGVTCHMWIALASHVCCSRKNKNTKRMTSLGHSPALQFSWPDFSGHGLSSNLANIQGGSGTTVRWKWRKTAKNPALGKWGGSSDSLL